MFKKNSMPLQWRTIVLSIFLIARHLLEIYRVFILYVLYFYDVLCYELYPVIALRVGFFETIIIIVFIHLCKCLYALSMAAFVGSTGCRFPC
jgi:hypothetical protein